MKFSLKRNIDTLGKTLRIFGGGVLLWIALFNYFNFTSPVFYILAIAGIFMLLEGILGYCIVMDMLGWSTYDEKYTKE